MSEDLIRRSDAIEAVEERSFAVRDSYTVKAILRNVPSADRPQEWIPCKDAISRQWLINNIEKGEEVEGGVFNTDSDSVKNFINVAPSIMVEPKQGEWIITGRTNIYGGIEVQCSNCGDKVMVQHLEDEWYCRHCGADMGMKGADDELVERSSE